MRISARIITYTISTATILWCTNTVTVTCFTPLLLPSSHSFITKPITTVSQRTYTPSCLKSTFLQQSAGDTNNNNSDYVNAQDGEGLQSLFAKLCDNDGLMTKETFVSIPVIADLLSVGDLMEEELDDIWNAAPKFPDLETSTERIDVDSFIQIYRDIDDIFEDDDDEITNQNGTTPQDSNSSSSTSGSTDDATDLSSSDNEEDEDDVDPENANDEKELGMVFKMICDSNGLVSRSALKEWSEIKDLLNEGMLGEDEFDKIWDRTTKSPGSDELDEDGFLSFNVALDDLFVFDDDEEDEEYEGDDNLKKKQIPMFYGEDLPPGVIFSEIADEDLLVGMNELRSWGDLQDMLNDGDLLPLELQNLFDEVQKAEGTNDKLDEEGFESLYDSIMGLFEEESESQQYDAPVESTKKDLMSYLTKLNNVEQRTPCGLESTDDEIQSVVNLVTSLETEQSNMVISKGGEISPEDIAGDWELLYTSSSTMKFNKGLSGLVPPNGKFGGLRQKLKASKYLSDVEYVEQINAGPASFEVRVTGDWELKNSVSLFTGSRSVALSVEPNKVSYGITSNRADHWKSLGPMNLLDITYLDNELRIMRGTTSTDSIFIFRRS